MLLNLIKMGFDITVIEGFDGRDFVINGEDYLVRAFGKETSSWQIKNSNITREQKYYNQLFKSGADIKCDIPMLNNIKSFLDKGYLVQATVNSKKLNGKDGYTGHSVLVFGYDNNGLNLHDPGLPPKENRFVTFDDFIDAWAYPNDTAKNLIAIKLGKKGFARV
jgi:hypothetical protein